MSEDQDADGRKRIAAEAVADTIAGSSIDDDALTLGYRIVDQVLSILRRPPTAESDSRSLRGVTFVLLRDDSVLLERCPNKREALGVGEWFIPGGKIENGEGPFEAVVREMGEELGIRPRLAQPLPIIEGSPIPPTSKGVLLMRPYLIETWNGCVPDATLDGGTPLLWTPIAEALCSPVPQVRAMVAMATALRAPAEA